MFSQQVRDAIHAAFQLVRAAFGEWVRKLKAAAPASELEFLGLL